MITKGSNQIQAGIVAVPKSQNDTGKPMAKAATLACDMRLCQPIAAAMMLAMVANSMATEECMSSSIKKIYKYQAPPQTPSAVKGQRIKFDN
jgi:hypothetical protein